MFASRAIGITFILALTSVFAAAQTSPQPAVNPESSGPPRTGAITGQVVDENGQPLKDAMVQIRAIGASAAQTASTDREGQFQVNGLAAANYNISAWKPAYQSGRPERRTRPYRIGDRVTLTLIKGGVVTGKVVDANGDPVVLVTVRAQMVRTAEGQAITGFYGAEARSTDDRGVYRLYGLREGTYVVFAGGPDQSGSTSADTVFQFDVPTYAPSATRETAAEISVRMGEEVSDVDIRYRGEQGRVVSGEVTVAAKSHGGVSVYLNTGGGETGSQYAETLYQSEDKRGFLFKGVADGEYSVMAQSYGSQGEAAISDSKQVTVQGADVTGIQLTTKLLGAVSGRVMLEETKVVECNSKDHPLNTETFVFARQKDDEAAKQIPQWIRPRTEPARPDDKGNFVFRNLTGAYYFVPSLKARQWYVHSITFAPPADATAKAKHVDAARIWTNVKMGDRLSGLTITLAQGGASLRGEFVPPQGERPPAGLMLYLVPAEREKANDVLRFFTTPIAQNGYFEMTNIAPGRYWVLAQTTVESPGAPSADVRLRLETETRAQIRRAAEAAKTEIELKPCQEMVDFKFPPKPKTEQ
jgi:hypothetical protein